MCSGNDAPHSVPGNAPPLIRGPLSCGSLGTKSNHLIFKWYIFRFYPVHYFCLYGVDLHACVFTFKRLLGTPSHLVGLLPGAQGTVSVVKAFQMLKMIIIPPGRGGPTEDGVVYQSFIFCVQFFVFNALPTPQFILFPHTTKGCITFLQ